MNRDSLVLVDSIALAKPEHRGKIIVAGSHGARIAGEHYAYPIGPKMVFFNDAGRGVDNAALGGVVFLGEHGVAAASIDTMSAMIGNAQDEYDRGVLSFVNGPAQAMGIKVGMTVREAVELADQA